MSLRTLAVGAFDLPPPVARTGRSGDKDGNQDTKSSVLKIDSDVLADVPPSPLPPGEFGEIYGFVRAQHGFAFDQIREAAEQGANDRANESLREKEVRKLRERLERGIRKYFDDGDLASLKEDLDLLKINLREFDYSLYDEVNKLFNGETNLKQKSLLAGILYPMDRNYFVERRIVPAFIKREEDKAFYLDFLRSLELQELREFFMSLRDLGYGYSEVFDMGCESTSEHKLDSSEYLETSKRNYQKNKENKKSLGLSLLELESEERGVSVDFIFNSLLDGADIREKDLKSENVFLYDYRLDRLTEIILYTMEALPIEREIPFSCITRLYEAAITDEVRDKVAALMLESDNYKGNIVSKYFRDAASDTNNVSIYDQVRAVEENNEDLSSRINFHRLRRLHAIEQYARLEGPYEEGKNLLLELLNQDDPLIVNKACEILASQHCEEKGLIELANYISSKIESRETSLPLACVLRLVGNPQYPSYVKVLKEVLSRDLSPDCFEEALHGVNEAVSFGVKEEGEKPSFELKVPKLPALVCRVFKPLIIWIHDGGGVPPENEEAFKLNAARILQCGISTDEDGEITKLVEELFNETQSLLNTASDKRIQAIRTKDSAYKPTNENKAAQAERELKLHEQFLIKLLGIVDMSRVSIPWLTNPFSTNDEVIANLQDHSSHSG